VLPPSVGRAAVRRRAFSCLIWKLWAKHWARAPERALTQSLQESLIWESCWLFRLWWPNGDIVGAGAGKNLFNCAAAIAWKGGAVRTRLVTRSLVDLLLLLDLVAQYCPHLSGHHNPFFIAVVQRFPRAISQPRCSFHSKRFSNLLYHRYGIVPYNRFVTAAPPVHFFWYRT